MKVRIGIVAIIGVAAIAAFHSALGAQHPPATTRTVLDGVYTEAQAKRGNAIYGEYCSSCHGQSLQGEDTATPLSGSQFFSNWNDTTVGELAERIRVSMPGNNPGMLSRQQSADVLAYLLNFNKFPAGTTELARETEIQNQIRILPPKLD